MQAEMTSTVGEIADEYGVNVEYVEELASLMGPDEMEAKLRDVLDEVAFEIWG